MYSEDVELYLEDYKDSLNKVFEHYYSEVMQIRAGRANPRIIEKIMVDYYGTMTPINQMATISVPEARMILVSVWDISILKSVVKAIESANIGVNPSDDGRVIRLVFPPLTEERRKELVKEANKLTETARVASRNCRREVLDSFKKMKKDNDITEDEMSALEKDVQKALDDSIALIDKTYTNKEKDIMEIQMNNNKLMPKHLAFIIDGNGRWAKHKGLPRSAGHDVGFKTLKKMITEVYNIGVPYMSVYCFSTGNWDRPQKEVDFLMKIFEKGLDGDFFDEELDIKVNFMGDLSAFGENIQQKAKLMMEKTKNNSTMVLNLGLNYGSREEIIRGINECLKEGKNSITIEEFNNYLYTANQPDPDMIIRTSGEQRLSNFMLWQASYAEFYFPEVHWPAFSKADLDKAIDTFSKRNRRFGAIKEEE